jgi:putative Mg2+ transporter-C (MgtC) family protein
MSDVGTVEIILRLVLSVGLGALVGYEREMSHKPAGLRTNMLVCLGACTFTVITLTSFSTTPAILSGILTGIGFIGAGSIIATSGHVQGITTAATLWAVASIGFASGAGSYVLASVAAVLVFIILQLKKAEEKYKENKYKIRKVLPFKSKY